MLCTTQVIAIVTDRLTDSAIIGDLHTAASRGVPVYVILNQRSIQENFTLNRLRHPVSHRPTETHTPMATVCCAHVTLQWIIHKPRWDKSKRHQFTRIRVFIFLYTVICCCCWILSNKVISQCRPQEWTWWARMYPWEVSHYCPFTCMSDLGT